jgi:hypothetical protein
MRLIPIYLNAEHRRAHDSLVEKLWRARVWMRMTGISRRKAPAIPPVIAKRRT